MKFKITNDWVKIFFVIIMLFFCQFFPLKCAGTGKNCVDFLCPRGAN